MQHSARLRNTSNAICEIRVRKTSIAQVGRTEHPVYEQPNTFVRNTFTHWAPLASKHVRFYDGDDCVINVYFDSRSFLLFVCPNFQSTDYSVPRFS